MISKLRRRHRQWTPVFIGMIPATILVAAIAVRPDAPVTGPLPAAMGVREELPPGRVSLGRIWDGLDLEASLGQAADRSQLVVEINNAPLKPDLLLFWSPAGAAVRATPETGEHGVADTDGGQLPADSVLVGVLRAAKYAVFDLPERTLAGEGRLVLYSLPYRQVVGVSELVRLH